MRICLYTPSFLPKIGGMEVVLDKLAREFQAQGHHVVVLAKMPRGNPELPSLPYKSVYYRRSRSAVWFLGSARRALLDQHARDKFDVISVHMTYPNGYVAVKLRNRLNVPIIITSHKGDIIPESRYRQRRITRRRMIWALSHADAATGVSTELKEIIDELAGGRANSSVIPNGVDLDPPRLLDAPGRFRALHGEQFLLTLGRLHPHKGLDVLLDAIAHLRDQDIEVPHLVIAGDGKLTKELRTQAARLRIGERVTFPGEVFGDEKQWLLHACRFFLQPSRAEGMPLTVLEAMASGKAIVGTDISGIRELVCDGQTGLLVPRDSAIELSGAIAKLLTSPDTLCLLSHGSLEKAREYSWCRIAEQYVRLFESLTGTKHCLRAHTNAL